MKHLKAFTGLGEIAKSNGLRANPRWQLSYGALLYIRTSNFGFEAERSYTFFSIWGRKHSWDVLKFVWYVNYLDNTSDFVSRPDDGVEIILEQL